MTGIERLRELGGAVSRDVRLYDVTSRDYDEREGLSVEHRGGLLGEIVEDIADQIAREHAEDCHRMGERAAEDAEAVAWVREHGGIAYVKDAWSVRSNLARQLETTKAKVERQQRHIEFVQGKCRERQERIVELNETSAEMRPRLMPGGMEWPRFEDGEMVLVGSDFADGIGETHTVTSVEFFDGCVELHWNPDEPGEFEYFHPGERVRRPAPKVLDADGVPIKVGDTVYPKYPYEEPDRQVESAEVVYVHRLGRIDVQAKYATGMSFRQQVDAEQLTHTKPEPHDSWERLEKDAKAAVCVYFGASDRDCGSCGHSSWECSYDKARDLVRRAKKLSGVGE